MSLSQSLRYFTIAMFFLVVSQLLPFLGNQSELPDKLIDDRKITVVTPAEAATKRAELIQFIWGDEGFPFGKLPSDVQLDIETPISNLPDLERVEILTIEMEGGIEGASSFFIPKHKNNRLIVIHQGHVCRLDDGIRSGNKDLGTTRLTNHLLSEGFSVLAVYMPHKTPKDCWDGVHDPMFDSVVNSGSPMKYFLEPTAVSLNYVKSSHHFEDIVMIGLSGGGWTTTLYAALDPTIQLSIPVAGSLPLYLRNADYVHDREQYLPAFYKIAGYPDLYVLGSYGEGRSQIQILNRNDDCCFGEKQHDIHGLGIAWDQAVRDYEENVQLALRDLRSGSFSVYIDETATGHTISENAILNIILPILDQDALPSPGNDLGMVIQP